MVVQKSWFPYEWLDNMEKLNFPGLPDYQHWYSALRGDFLLSPQEFEECKHLFQEKGMHIFRDWLEYYNNLNVGPFLEALQKMKAFYIEKSR